MIGGKYTDMVIAGALGVVGVGIVYAAIRGWGKIPTTGDIADTIESKTPDTIASRIYKFFGADESISKDVFDWWRDDTDKEIERISGKIE